MLADFKPLARALGFPYFPLTITFPWLGPLGFVPLPVKYAIRYGEPFRFYEEYPPDTVNDPEKVRSLADRVRLTIQEMIDQGLQERKAVFSFDTGWMSKGTRKRRL